MNQPITGYHKDDQNDWVAELRCGHFQHIRHNPPWEVREWTQSPEERDSHLGHLLYCKKCEYGDPPDQV